MLSKEAIEGASAAVSCEFLQTPSFRMPAGDSRLPLVLLFFSVQFCHVRASPPMLEISVLLVL